MCCITELPIGAPLATSRQPAIRIPHRKSASMDSFFMSTLLSKELFAPSAKVAPALPLPSMNEAAEEDAEKENRCPGLGGPAEHPLRRRARTEDCFRDAAPSFTKPKATTKPPLPPKKKIKKSVRFSTVQIREHALVIGDSPSCTTGLPLSLDWRHAVPVTAGVDAYERTREGKRITCCGNLAATELQLSRRRRMELLVEAGGYQWRELVREERRVRMRERDEFFGRVPSTVF